MKEEPKMPRTIEDLEAVEASAIKHDIVVEEAEEKAKEILCRARNHARNLRARARKVLREAEAATGKRVSVSAKRKKRGSADK